MDKLKNNILIRNKRASFDYELVDFYKAGIVLVGTEIKSIRLGKASLVDTFCFFTERNGLFGGAKVAKKLVK